jgi:pilus assembly protein CpaB
VRSRSLVVALSFVLATTATLAVFLYVQGVQSSARTGAQEVSVVVSKDDIPAGTQLDDLIAEGGFTKASIPREDLIRGAITSLTQLEGRETSAAILAGEQISTARMRGSSTQVPGGALGIPPGFHAFTIPLEPARVAGGAIQSGDHVSIFATFDSSGGSKAASTVSLVPDAKVLAVDTQMTQEEEEEGQTQVEELLLTLALEPQDGQSLVFALEEGSIWLSLLPPDEEGAAQPPVSFPQVIE